MNHYSLDIYEVVDLGYKMVLTLCKFFFHKNSSENAQEADTFCTYQGLPKSMEQHTLLLLRDICWSKFWSTFEWLFIFSAPELIRKLW